MGRAGLALPLLTVALYFLCCTPVFTRGQCLTVQLNSSNQVIITNDGDYSASYCFTVSAPPGNTVRATLTNLTCLNGLSRFSFDELGFFSVVCQRMVEVFSPRELLVVYSSPDTAPDDPYRFSFQAFPSEPVCDYGYHLCAFNNGSFCISDNTTCLCLTDGYCSDGKGDCPYIFLDSNQAVSISEEIGLYSEWNGNVTKGTNCWVVPILPGMVVSFTFQPSIDQFFLSIAVEPSSLTESYSSFVVPRRASYNGYEYGTVDLRAALYNESSNSTFAFTLQKSRDSTSTNPIGCGSDEFRCGDNICYDSAIVCDGIRDCDEKRQHDEDDCNYCEDNDPIVLPVNSEYDIKYPDGLLRGFPTSIFYSRVSCSWTVHAGTGQVVRIRFLVSTTHLPMIRFQLAFLVGRQNVANYGRIREPSRVVDSDEVKIRLVKYYMDNPAQFHLRVESEYPVSCERETEFSCEPDNACIPISKRCDGFPDCESKTDEIGCGECRNKYFRCSASDADSTCVHVNGLCDLSPDCANMYDELNCAICGPPVDLSDGGIYQLSGEVTCVWLVSASPGHFIGFHLTSMSPVNSGSICVGAGHDPSNESSTIVDKSTSTIPKRFTVHSEKAWVSFIDPDDYFSFEMTQLSELVICNTTTEFACSSGVQCVPAYARCDSVRDCDDYSDELGCYCEEDQFACPSGTKCLNQSSVCNGIHECPTYADEISCLGCQEGEFACSTGECIAADKVCDRKSDCRKLNDEFNCGFCVESSMIALNATVSRLFSAAEFDGNPNCVWTITSEPSTRILVNILENRGSQTTFCDGSYGNFVRNNNSECTALAIIEQGSKTFPQYISSSGPALWIKSLKRISFRARKIRLTVSQFVDIVCQNGEYKCPSGRNCIAQSAVCDGWPDCPEYKDEFGCRGCSVEEFACGDGSGCHDKESICSGSASCVDKSDEFNCDPCGNSLINVTLGFGNLTSPRWPGNYPSSVECYWVVVASEQHRILVIFLEFETEGNHDFLQWSSGRSFTYGLKIKGSDFPSRVASRGNELSLYFKSDYYSNRKGFLLQFEQRREDAISCANGEVLCDYTEFICVPKDTELSICPQNNCGEEMVVVNRNQPVNFSSPNYPANYDSKLHCTWTIITSQILVLFVQIEDFSTEATFDIVEFQAPTFYKVLPPGFEMHGTTKVRAMVFNSSSISVKFTTDRSFQRRGFLLWIQSILPFQNQTWCEELKEICESIQIAQVPVSCTMHEQSLFDCQDGSCVVPEARCNGFTDCKSGLDEQDCENIHCPQFYACGASSQCIYWQNVCDGIADCDFGDDEIDCDTKRCPDGCQCSYDVSDFHVRCQQGWSTDTPVNTAKRTQALELTHGDIPTLELGGFKGLHYLQALYLTDNNIQRIEEGAFDGLQIKHLDISSNNVTKIASPIFLELNLLETLVMEDVPIQFISSDAFLGLSRLRTLVIITNFESNMFLEVEKGAFQKLESLHDVYVDDYRLCCDFAELKHFSYVTNCHTTELQPPLNLCGSLLQTHVLRVALWVLGLSALLGNAVVIIWRIKGTGGRGGKKTHSFMVLNLAISDLMMGVYMLIIAVADLAFGETYFRTASLWRSHVVCKVAGVLSVLSSEASVFFVTLISVDCFLSIVFPFSDVHLRERSTKIVVGLLWFVALCLSVPPTVSVGPDSDLYGLSDVCIGLPFTTKATGDDSTQAEVNNPLGSQQLTLKFGTDKKPAWILSLVLFLGVNLACFVVVFCCYIAIFVSVKRSSKLVRQSTHRNREIRMAVKMALIVGTDFACWMPVIIMGILSQTNMIEIGAYMYGWIVVFILPINSSLNPYLYTIYTACTPETTSNCNSKDKLSDLKAKKTRSAQTVEVRLSKQK